MYHCHLDFYCVGRHPEIYDIIREMPPLEAFTHSFILTGELAPHLAERVDVILADIRDTDGEELLRTMLFSRRVHPELILLAEHRQVAHMSRYLDGIQDIWIMPMTDEELRFRFLKWQENYKLRTDYWQTNQFLDVTINNTPTLIWYKRRDGLHEKVNDSYCRAAGKTREQILGKCHTCIWNVEKEDPSCIESDREVLDSGVTRISEEIFQTGSGRRTLTTYKSPLFDLNGSVMGTVGVGLDVTRERAYKEDIVQKNRTMEWLFTTMECGVVCHTMDGRRIISINRAALQILGYRSKEEIEADGFDTVAASVLDDDKPKLRHCIQSLQVGGQSANIEYRVRHKDGSIYYVMGNIKLVEENGEWFYQRFLLDVTAQKVREEARQQEMDQQIRYQKQLFEIFSTYLARSTDDVYMMLSGEGDRVEYVSPNVERVLGISAREIEENLGHFGRAQYDDGGAVERERLWNLKPGEAIEPKETKRVNRKTGEEKWFRESVYCEILQNEKKIIVYISDRTKERKTQDNLAEALAMAQVANKAKSAFLGNVSHDIRTPMNAIMGFITLLRQEAYNPELVLEYSQRIDTASQHLLGLINDVLDLNKIESGSATLHLGDLNLAEIIDEINAIIRPQAKARDQTFHIHTSALTYEHLIGDRLRINQILINILSNAVKYTQKGGSITMTVAELPQAVANYSRVRFTITDNGQGMSEAYQKVIFTPFTREQATLTNQVQGTGLGMSITKNLVDMMGGSIQVKSQIGKGSTFTVELELRIQEKETDPKFWEKNGITHVLVADDELDICRSVVQSMEGVGIKAEYALDGQKAVDMVHRAQEDGQPYDLVLMDWKMPGTGGMEAARQIRDSGSDKLPIVILTAYDWEEIKDEALKIGIGNFLNKPFFISNFKETVCRLIGSCGKAVPNPTKQVVNGKRVLVVDDIEVNRMILKKILSTLGAACETAENGQEALDKFVSSAPGEYDLILMDVQMPIMDGYTASRAIRASSHPSAKTVAVIAMTANAFVDDVREALAAGMDAHIAKPIVVNKMTDIIQDVLDHKRR